MTRLMACMFAVLSVLSFATADWQPPNLVQNPGFEELAEDGLPAHWAADMKVYTPVTKPTHSGERALQFVNPDPNNYVLCGQNIPLEPGKAYEVSVWIKTEDIKGEDSGATICLEWWGENGEYLGGHYPRGFKGDTDWRQLKSAGGRVHKDAVRCNVTCYVRKGMTGKAWWDDVAVRAWRGPALKTMLLEPNYRGQIGPRTKEIKFAAELTLADYELELEEVALRAHLIRKKDMKVVRSERWVPHSSEVVLAIPRTGLRRGKYELKVTLERLLDGREIGSDSWRLEVVRPAKLARRASYIDEHNRLILNRKPFFPLGMYWGGINEDDIKLYADSAFNCLMPYGAPNKEKMDLAHEHGLKVIYTLKDIYYGSKYSPNDVKTIEEERKVIQAKAESFRDHPALLAWYLNDELPISMMDRLEAHQEWMEELDPNHPTWVVLYQVGQLKHYRKTFDAIGTDPYPIPLTSAGRAGDWARRTVRSLKGRRPVWMVPQVFNWGCYRKTEEEKRGLRPPTLPEMRSMAWQCITEGANGLVFYSFFDLKRDTLVPFEEQWGKVKQMAAEIEEMIPVILSVERAPQIEVSDYAWLHWTTRKLRGATYLIAANADDTKRKARFSLGAKPSSIQLRGSAEEVQLHAGDRLEAQFEPFEVRVYEIKF